MAPNPRPSTSRVPPAERMISPTGGGPKDGRDPWLAPTCRTEGGATERDPAPLDPIFDTPDPFASLTPEELLRIHSSALDDDLDDLGIGPTPSLLVLLVVVAWFVLAASVIAILRYA